MLKYLFVLWMKWRVGDKDTLSIYIQAQSPVHYPKQQSHKEENANTVMHLLANHFLIIIIFF